MIPKELLPRIAEILKTDDGLERIVSAAVFMERERCARIAENYEPKTVAWYGSDIAAEIRKRDEYWAS